MDMESFNLDISANDCACQEVNYFRKMRKIEEFVFVKC